MLPTTKRIFVSNRLPFSINDQTGELVRGSGGLVSALLGVTLNHAFGWFGFETNAPQAQALCTKTSQENKQMLCRPVILDKNLYDQYYDGFANDVIWPLFHYESQLNLFKRENWEAYVTANRTMAEAIAKEAGPEDTVWIHDFHFMMLPQFLRELSPQLKIGFFLHIPFPSAEIFRQLPVREEVMRSLVQCDLLGFHEHSYLRHFIVSLKAVLGIDSSFFKAQIGDHTLNLGVYPISIDTRSMKEKAASPAVVEKCREYLAKSHVEFLFLGVDRLDYTKGLELKLRGFQRALQKYPELVGKIGLLQVAVPTRQKVPYYIQIKKEMDQLVGNINGAFAKPDYTPVHYIYNSVEETDLLALYRRANATLVTSKRDGMNLVAMEYAVCQDPERPGVLILSEFAGAASLLSDALIINPWDADEVADSIYQAYKMSVEEKRSRMESLQNILAGYSATKWAQSFLGDLDESRRESEFKVTNLPIESSAWPLNFTAKLKRTQKIQLIVDYDGTLVSFAKKPHQALLIVEMKELLRKLSDEIDIVVLSGRARSFLDEQFAGMPVVLVAEHGAFYRSQEGEWQTRLFSDISTWYTEAERVMESYCDRVPFSSIERKEAALVWHFRESPETFADFQAKKLDDELQVGLSNEAVSVVMGSKIVEAKSIECNKGSFVRWLMQLPESAESVSLAIGDDRTDEDMFAVMGDNDLSIKVGPGPTQADYRLRSQVEVFRFLNELYSFVQQRHQSEFGMGDLKRNFKTLPTVFPTSKIKSMGGAKLQ